MPINDRIYSTPFTNDAAGWRALAGAADTMTAKALADICQWHDPNGDWCFSTMIAIAEDGLTVGEVHTLCRDQIAVWAAELVA